MKVILLGTAAGGGYPQWNCACAMCRRAGDDDSPARTQDCVAVSADGSRWLLLNASPDIRSQTLRTPELAAGPGPRQTPITAAALTDAELDHALGLLLLREAADSMSVHASTAVLEALDTGFPLRRIVTGYGGWTFTDTADTADAVATFTDIGLEVTVHPVGDKRPKYARDVAANGPWVVAYRIHDPATGGSFVYAPCLATWPEGFDAFVGGATRAVIDGTFFSPEEMSGATASGVSAKAQRRMGHIPMIDSLPLTANHPGVQWAYTHLNNTNPTLCTSSAEYAQVQAAGVEIPPDGTTWEL